MTANVDEVTCVAAGRLDHFKVDIVAEELVGIETAFCWSRGAVGVIWVV